MLQTKTNKLKKIKGTNEDRALIYWEKKKGMRAFQG